VKLVRWGWSEYEQADLPGLPEGVHAIAMAGPEAPLEEADVLVVPSTVRVDGPAVARLRRCKLVITTTSGFDHIDLRLLRARGVPCARLPLARRDAVVETTLGMMLSLTRRLGRFQQAAVEGKWERKNLADYGATLLGTVGVVGVGVIGSRLATILEAMGARVLRCDPVLPAGVALARLLDESEVVTLHCELTAANRGMIGEDEIRRLRRGAVLLNTARGPLLDVEAAVASVRAGHLSGLGLDVFPEEPAALGRYADPRILLTPHAAGWHPSLGAKIAEGVATALRALLDGGGIPYLVT